MSCKEMGRHNDKCGGTWPMESQFREKNVNLRLSQRWAQASSLHTSGVCLGCQSLVSRSGRVVDQIGSMPPFKSAAATMARSNTARDHFPAQQRLSLSISPATPPKEPALSRAARSWTGT